MADRPRCFRVHPDDNVATLLDDAPADAPLLLLGSDADQILTAAERIAAGHKVALRALAADEPVIKYGVPIGRATRAVAAGAWVHLHNCASYVDERSQHLDVHSGAVSDTRYE